MWSEKDSKDRKEASATKRKKLPPIIFFAIVNNFLDLFTF